MTKISAGDWDKSQLPSNLACHLAHSRERWINYFHGCLLGKTFQFHLKNPALGDNAT